MNRNCHHKAKLTPEQVREIRANKKGLSYRELARQFGVHINTAKRAGWGFTWKHL